MSGISNSFFVKLKDETYKTSSLHLPLRQSKINSSCSKDLLNSTAISSSSLVIAWCKLKNVYIHILFF